MGSRLTVDSLSQSLAVLSQTAARTLFGGENAVGRTVSAAQRFDAGHTFQVVGVAHDVRFTPRDPYDFLVYYPITQVPAPVTEAILRTAGDPAAMVSRVRAAIHEVDADVPVGEIRPLTDIVELNLAHEKMMALLSACFGLVALALTCIGVYGVIAYAAKRRTQEIGIRLALGADARQVAFAMLGDLALPVFGSLLLGGAATVAAGPAIRSQLFGIAPHDYSMLGGSAVLLAVIAAAAGYLPARHAARLDPMEALREE